MDAPVEEAESRSFDWPVTPGRSRLAQDDKESW